jgi:predicted nucleotidyltransferase
VITLENVKKKRQRIFEVAREHGAENIRIFGSVARGEAGPQSDIDFLISLEPGRSALDIGGFLMDLQDLLGCRVDIVTESGLNKLIKDQVLKEAVSL